MTSAKDLQSQIRDNSLVDCVDGIPCKLNNEKDMWSSTKPATIHDL